MTGSVGWRIKELLNRKWSTFCFRMNGSVAMWDGNSPPPLLHLTARCWLYHVSKFHHQHLHHHHHCHHHHIQHQHHHHSLALVTQCYTWTLCYPQTQRDYIFLQRLEMMMMTVIMMIWIRITVMKIWYDMKNISGWWKTLPSCRWRGWSPIQPILILPSIKILLIFLDHIIITLTAMGSSISCNCAETYHYFGHCRRQQWWLIIAITLTYDF